MSNEPTASNIPSALKLHGQSRTLEIKYVSNASYVLSFEFLRVHSPSAEVQGHGPGQEVLQVGKREVVIEALEPVGHYGVKPRFSDGHETGIYSWDYLHWLGENQPVLWQQYLDRLAAAGASRDMPGDARVTEIKRSSKE
jgi:DUF971 family protein